MQAYYVDHSSMQVHYMDRVTISKRIIFDHSSMQVDYIDQVTMQAYYVHHVSMQVRILYSVLGYHVSMQVYHVSCKCISLIYPCKWFVDRLTIQVYVYYIDHVTMHACNFDLCILC